MDVQCYSGWCDKANGVCGTAWGACDCPSGVCSADGTPTCDGVGTLACTTTRLATSNPPGGDNAPLESVQLDGATTGVRLVNSGLTSPLGLMAGPVNGGDDNEFQVRFDFRFDGFADGETEQVIMSSGTFELAVVWALFGAAIRATVWRDGPGGPTADTLWLPWTGQGEAVEPGRWYRVLWAVVPQVSGSDTDNYHMLQIERWNLRLGNFEDEGEEACVYRDWDGSDLAETGDVWFGRDAPGAAATRFHGRIDSVNLGNRRMTMGKTHPSDIGCLNVGGQP